jgi:hypothetical protein
MNEARYGAAHCRGHSTYMIYKEIGQNLQLSATASPRLESERFMAPGKARMADFDTSKNKNMRRSRGG